MQAVVITLYSQPWCCYIVCRFQMVDSTITYPEYAELPLQERIKAPLVWARLTVGVRIEDLQEKRFPEAVQLLRVTFNHC